MKIKIAAGCQNESATNAVISAVGPPEEPFIGKFYKISQCAVTNTIWIEITRCTIHSFACSIYNVCIYFLVYEVEIPTETVQTGDSGKELGHGEKAKGKMHASS